MLPIDFKATSISNGSVCARTQSRAQRSSSSFAP